MTQNKASILSKARDRFGLSYSYCKQGALHLSPQELDWSSKDWDGTKAKVKEETNSLTDYNTLKPQTNIDPKADVDKIAFSKLQIRQGDLKEKLVEVTDMLIPPPMTKTPEDIVEKSNSDKLSKAERKLQQEEEKYKLYQRVYMGQLSEEEESNTEPDC